MHSIRSSTYRPMAFLPPLQVIDGRFKLVEIALHRTLEHFAFAFADLIGIRMRCSADGLASSMNLSTISFSAALAISAMSKSCGLIL